MDDFLKNAIQTIPQDISHFLGGVGNAVGGAVQGVEHMLQPQIQSPVPQQQTLPQAQPNPISQNVSNFVGGAEKTGQNVLNYLAQTPQRIESTIQKTPILPPQFTQGVQNFAQGFTSGPDEAANNPKNTPYSIYSLGNFLANDVGGGLGGAIKEVPQEGKAAFNLTRGAIGAGVNAGTVAVANLLAGKPTNPQDLLIPGAIGFATGGITGGSDPLASIPDKVKQQLDSTALDEFKNGFKNLSPQAQSDPVIAQIKPALNVGNGVEKSLSSAITTFKKGGIEDPTSNNILNFATSKFLPQFTSLNTLDKARIWDNILDLKYGQPTDQIHPLLQPTIGSIKRDILQAGRVKLDLGLGGEEKPTVQPGQVGEQAIGMDDVANYAPHLTTAKGVNKVQHVLDNAEQLKPSFDQDIKAIADDNGADFSSRIKSMDSSIRKITQQRMEGKDDYNQKGLNDPYGARIIIKDPKDEQAVINDINDAAKDGQFEILKQQPVDKETYHAYHIDIQKRLPDGTYVRGEIQIHTPQSLAEAVKNHPIRSVFGENPPPQIDALKEANAQAANSLTNEEAKQATDILLDKHKQQGEVNTLKEELTQQPLPPKMSTRAIQEGVETPRTGKDISVSTQAGQRYRAENFEKEMDELASKPIGKEFTNPEIATDESAKNQGNVMGGSFTGNLDPEVKGKFADWVNARSATEIQGLAKNKEFSNLNQKGLQGILDYQTAEKTPEFSGVKKYFDDKRQQVIDTTGRDFGYKKDYLPQLWKESPEQVTQVMGNRLSQSAQFTLHSLIQDYEEGISKGLHPRFNTIGELAGWYEQKANKLLADSDFFNYLADKGLILPKSKASDWVSLDPDRFPRITVHLPEGGTYNGTYAAPKPLADMINNYLKPAGDNWITKVGNMASFMKQMVMSTGIPFTAITPHTFNELVRALAFKNPIEGEAKTIGYSIFPKLAGNWIEDNLGKADFWAKNGLKFSAIEEAPKEGFAGMLNKVNIFNRHQDLFNKVIPALKMQYADELFGRLKGQGMDEGEATKLAAKTSNTIFGGINWEEWGRSRDNMKIASVIGFAPDWLETNLRLGAGITKALFNPADPRGRAYLTFAGNLAAAYTLANVINQHNTGKLMIQNPNGHEFDIAIGFTSDGQVRYLRPFGTGIDFVRLPVEIGAGLAKGDFSGIPNLVRNRLSTFIGTALSLISNTDYLGQGIYTDQNHPEISTLQSIGNIGATVGSGIIPGVATQGIKAATGGFQGWEQAISALIGSPLRYSGGPGTQNLVTQDQKQGKTGPQITQDLSDMIQRAQNKTNVIGGINMTGTNGKTDTQLTTAVKDAVTLYYDTQSNDWQTRLLKDQLLTSPALFDAIKKVAVANANGDTSKVDPLLTADDQTRKDYLTYERLQNSAYGSAEEKQFIKDHQDIVKLMSARNTYFTANPIPNGQTRASIFGMVSPVPPAPQASTYVQQQLNAKNYNDPQVQQYLSQHLDYVNQIRKSQGLGLLDQYGNIQGSKNFGIGTAGMVAANNSRLKSMARSMRNEARYEMRSGNNKVRSLLGKLSGNYKPIQHKPISLGSKIATVKIGPHRGLGVNLPKQSKSTIASSSKPKSLAVKYQKSKKQHIRLA